MAIIDIPVGALWVEVRPNAGWFRLSPMSLPVHLQSPLLYPIQSGVNKVEAGYADGIHFHFVAEQPVIDVAPRGKSIAASRQWTFTGTDDMLGLLAGTTLEVTSGLTAGIIQTVGMFPNGVDATDRRFSSVAFSLHYDGNATWSILRKVRIRAYGLDDGAALTPRYEELVGNPTVGGAATNGPTRLRAVYDLTQAESDVLRASAFFFGPDNLEARDDLFNAATPIITLTATLYYYD